jgi:hypothetical protein
MTTHRTDPQIPGFRLGIYVFKDAEIVDYTAPYGRALGRAAFRSRA